MLLRVSVKLLILPWLEPRMIISPKAIILKQSSLLTHSSYTYFFPFVVVVVIFFKHFSSILIGFTYAQNFWQTIAKTLHTKTIFFFLLSSITVILHPILIYQLSAKTIWHKTTHLEFFFLSLLFSFPFLSLNLQMVPIQRAVPQVTPICSTKFPQLFKSN